MVPIVLGPAGRRARQIYRPARLSADVRCDCAKKPADRHKSVHVLIFPPPAASLKAGSWTIRIRETEKTIPPVAADMKSAVPVDGISCTRQHRSFTHRRGRVRVDESLGKRRELQNKGQFASCLSPFLACVPGGVVMQSWHCGMSMPRLRMASRPPRRG